MHLEMLREKYIKNGYSPTTASAKICQDIILYKIAKSTLNRNVTIKGGVIMYNLSNDKRRATKDLDLDFIRYSLDDESIKGFINKLNDMDDNITIYINDSIKKLHHQDYDGKRVEVSLVDEFGYEITSKLDIGIHKNFDIMQDEYCFNLDTISESVTLIINSKEQMICEKLKSLLKLGIRSTRYKDIFDIYYLINYTLIDKKKLLDVINVLILNDINMRQIEVMDIVNDLKIILIDENYIKKLSISKNNWLAMPIKEVILNILDYFESLLLICV